MCERIGITKKDTMIDHGVLENCVREELDRTAPRALAVLQPLRVVIENYSVDQVETLPAANHPKDPALGTRELPFSREILIERDDFRADPPRDFFRLAPGREVRLRYAYLIKCHDVRTDPVTGEPIELRCTYDPASRGGVSPDGRKVKSTIHWVDARQGVVAEVRLFDPLFDTPNPAGAKNFLEHLNPEAKQVRTDCVIEPALASALPEQRFQFERLGYFSADQQDHRAARPVFNRIVTLRDSRPGS
jgi:glutaminyl-tRNA synthetase